MKTLKLWQIAVLAAVLLGAAGGTYGVYSLVSGSEQEKLSQDQQLIPVQYGNLVNQVSTNGSIIFPNKEMLTFGAQGTVGEILAEVGQQVKEGDTLARVDAATMASLEKAVLQARLNLRNAEDVLAKAQAQADSEKMNLSIAKTELKLTQKEWDSKLLAAQKTLDTARDGYPGEFVAWLGIEPSPDQINLAPDTLLASWGVDLTSLFNRNLRFMDISVGNELPIDNPATPWNELTVYFWLNMYPGYIAPTCENGSVPARGACVKKEMDDAWDAYQKAQDNLASVQIQSERAMARARDSLAAAEQTLATLPLMVALREAEVASAQAALETALQRLEGATLKAHAAGVVSLVNVEAGQSVNANTPIVEVVDPTVVEVDGIVDEIDVLFVRLEARADVTMDALPGQVLRGTVSEIASAARTQQGVVSYPIRILVQVPEGVELREGLSATASIVIREERNVLLVPIQALYGTFEQPVVKVKTDGRVEERPVVLGSSDDYWVAVRQGLVEGEQVVMEAQAATTTGQLGILGGGLRQFQGQFRPGGGGVIPGGRGEGGTFGGQRQRATPVPRR